MVKKLFICLVAIMILACTITPVYADTTAPEPESSVSESNSDGAIAPVSPKQFTDKVNNMVEGAHEAGKPIVYRISQLMIIVTGLILLFSFFVGHKIMQRAFGALLCVGVGVFLYLNSKTISGIIVWISNYLGTGGN